MKMKDHEAGCPVLQFWDGGEIEVSCSCGDYIEIKDYKRDMEADQ